MFQVVHARPLPNADDDARCYDRQQAYVPARGGQLPPRSRGLPKPELIIVTVMCTNTNTFRALVAGPAWAP